MPDQKHESVEDQQAQEHFFRTHLCTAEGHYVVRLPLDNSPPIEIGQALNSAISQLHRFNKRLQHNSSIAKAYNEFLEEYKVGHIAAVSPEAIQYIFLIIIRWAQKVLPSTCPWSLMSLFK